MTEERRGLPVDEFVAPLPLLAVAVLAVNDQLLKGSGLLPGWLTGKLSDFAGLFFFPLFLSALLGLLLRRPTSVRRLTVCVGVTVLLFSLLQLSSGFEALYLAAHRAVAPWWRFEVTRDPTDLAALPMSALAWWYGVRTVRRRGRADRPSSP